MSDQGNQGNIVEKFTIGNTQIEICDDYCRDKTPEDVNRILDKIARDALAALSAHSSFT